MLVLVTGATGFLGNLTTRQLLAAGMDVRALVRATSRTEALEVLGVQIVRGSLHPPERLAEALVDVEAVIHCAGGGMARRVESFYENNRDTTVHLLEEIDRSAPRVERFLLVSSLAAQGPCREPAAPGPEVPPAPISHYGRAKLEAEAAALERRQRMCVTILRPPAIYGPADTRMLSLYRAAKRGFVPIPRPSRGSSMIFGEDCAQAMVAIVGGTPESGRVYGIEDGELLSTVERARLIGQAVGRTPWTPRVPGPVVRAIGWLSEGLARLRGREAILGRERARDLCQPWWVSDSSALREELGWRSTMEFAEGARLAADWYRANGWI